MKHPKTPAFCAVGPIATLAGMAIALSAVTATAQGISDDVVKIGLILDMSGVYADVSGRGSVTAAELAIADFGGTVAGKKIELIYADHQNKPDIASTKAREWFDTQKVDTVQDVTGSATALAVLQVAKEKNRIAVFSQPGTDLLTNAQCSTISAHWTYDTYSQANTVAKALVDQGKKDWYFLTLDLNIGHDLEKNATAPIMAGNGKVLGVSRHPLNAPDFSSFIVKAQTSGASVIGLANAGGDVINAIKTARTFGVGKGANKQILAPSLLLINDVHALGLETSQDITLAEAFYWDMNDQTRAFSRRYFEKMKRMPNQAQAGLYSSVTHYLKAVKATGTDDTAIVMRKMKATPVNDMFTKNGLLREDGRMVHDMYVFKVKAPSESNYAWDYYKRTATIPGAQAFRPLSKSECPLVKKS